MAEITATLVRALREETGQGMMECKRALEQTGGDKEAARDLLRKKGLLTAERKAGRATSEGLIGIRINEARTGGVMVEVRCETDFCARNEVFRDMVQAVTDMAAAGPEGKVQATAEMDAAVKGALAKIRENMSFARGIRISAPCVAGYLHHNGKVGVLVGVEGPLSEETLADLCMHVAFADPMGINPQDIPERVIAKEREIAQAQAMEAGKPQPIAQKMVEGKIRKFIEANALVEQPFVKDDKKKVKDVLGKARVAAMARLAVGVDP
jgi:elongation factor Ts